VTPRRWVVVAAVLALVALGTTAWNLNGAWDARRDAIDARDQARGQLADVRATLATQRNRLHEARLDRARAVAERDGASVSIQLRNEQLAATTASRNDAASSRDAKMAEVAVVRQCIGGANTALDSLQRLDTAGTVAALRLVDGACRAAQSTQGGPSPQYGFDFPDPFVLVAGADHFAFATNSSGGNIQVLHQQGAGSWATAGDALGRFPAWATAGKTWAPSVLPRMIGYVMYYTVREAATGRQCVSRATSLGPGGPYVDTSTGPLVCGDREALDPEPTVAADDTPVLLWKRERPAAIVAQPLTADGLGLTGTERELLRANQRWEDSNVEAPSMLVTGGGSWLFFSGGSWNGAKYATGVVHCAGALGPCDRSSAAPLLASHERIAGPGGASVFQEAPGTFWLAYHAYVNPNVGYPASRLLFTATIDLRSGHPVIVDG
jgi:hypothetical protein